MIAQKCWSVNQSVTPLLSHFLTKSFAVADYVKGGSRHITRLLIHRPTLHLLQ